MIKKIIIVLILIAILTLLGYKIYFYFIANTKGVLIIKTQPLKGILKINNDTYQIDNGLLKIKLAPGEYNLIFSAPSYYSESRNIVISTNSVTKLELINLLPLNWQDTTVINNSDIEFFILNTQKNLIVYLIADKKKYNWYLYNRSTKDNIQFYQSDTLPAKIIFLNDDKKLLVELKPKEWWLLFLPKTLLSKGINLNTAFINQLKQQDNYNKDIKIKEIIDSNNSNEVIINTTKGIYRYNYISQDINQIFDEITSSLARQNNNLYFIKKNGLLTQLNLNTLQMEEISLFKFYDSSSTEDLGLIKIHVFDNSGKNIFVIYTPKNNYIISLKEVLPQKLNFDIDQLTFNNTYEQFLAFCSSSKTIILYDLNKSTPMTLNINSDNLPYWFLNNEYLLFIFKNGLYIYDLKQNLTYPVKSGIKNNLYYYDANLNYIFYLDNVGIKLISI